MCKARSRPVLASSVKLTARARQSVSDALTEAGRTFFEGSSLNSGSGQRAVQLAQAASRGEAGQLDIAYTVEGSLNNPWRASDWCGTAFMSFSDFRIDQSFSDNRMIVGDQAAYNLRYRCRRRFQDGIGTVRTMLVP